MALGIVIKLGTSSLIHPETGNPAIATMAALVELVVKLRKAGHRVVLVSSGAVGMGLRRLHISGGRPKLLPQIQAVAAVGQGRLIALWDDLFAHVDQPIAQVLLTRTDLSERSHYLNAVNTFSALLEYGVVPIVNENDTVSVAEIRFGDNDTLSALVAGMIKADWLFLMTDVDSLYTANPRLDPQAKPIREVHNMQELRETISIGDAGTQLGTGGMATKWIAAELATSAGCHCAVVSSSAPVNVFRLLNGDRDIGTVFYASTAPLTDRIWWIRHGLRVRGTLFVDAGAAKALRERHSLLPAGLKSVQVDPVREKRPGAVQASSNLGFSAQQCVRICEVTNGQAVEIARALVNYNSSELERLCGAQTSEIVDRIGYCDAECVAHRDNVVLL